MRNKGLRREQHLDDYTIFDIETCGVTPDMRNHIIELSAIKVRQGVVTDEFSTLVKPAIRIPQLITSITGISNDMVSCSPDIQVVLPEFIDFISDDVLVGYNINTFDYNIIYDVAEQYLGKIVSNDFVDIIYAARQNVTNVCNYKLSSLCQHFNIDTEGAHRALNDCYMTKSLYDELFQNYGSCAFGGGIFEVEQYISSNSRGTHFSDATMQLRRLQEILNEIVSDNEVTIAEVNDLYNWMEENKELKGNYPFDRVYRLLNEVFEDGEVDSDELALLLDKFTEYTNPVESSHYEKTIVIENHHFVLTGEFDYGSRSKVETYIEEKHGIIDNTVKKCTNYVIVGSSGSQAWSSGNYGSKIKKAMEAKDKGQDIEIITEKEFFGG